MSTALAFDATVQTFQSAVMERSMTVPVLIDFWAEWCGPCKALGPILEDIVTEYDGAFVLAKVDSEAELELGQAFQVQSIPFVVLVVEGRPVDAFSGAVGADQVRQFLTKHGIEPASESTAGTAAEEDAPDSPAVRLRAARAAVAAGDVEIAREALTGFPEEDARNVERTNILSGLAFLEAELDGPLPAARHLRQAREHFLAGRWENALEAIVESAAADRTYGDGLARKAMLLMQGSLDATDVGVVDDYRRRLATLLY